MQEKGRQLIAENRYDEISEDMMPDDVLAQQLKDLKQQAKQKMKSSTALSLKLPKRSPRSRKRLTHSENCWQRKPSACLTNTTTSEAARSAMLLYRSTATRAQAATPECPPTATP